MAEVEEHEIVNNSRVSTDDLSFQYTRGGEVSGWSPVRTHFLSAANVNQNADTTEKRRSSLACEGRGELPTCGSVSPIQPPAKPNLLQVNRSDELTSVFYSSKTISESRRETDFGPVLTVGLALAVFSPLAYLALRDEWLGIRMSTVFILLGLGAIGIVLVRCVCRRSRRKGYSDLSTMPI